MISVQTNKTKCTDKQDGPLSSLPSSCDRAVYTQARSLVSQTPCRVRLQRRRTASLPCSASLDPPANVVAMQCDTGAPATPSMHIQSQVGDAATIADATYSEACASDAQQCKRCTTNNHRVPHTCGKARSTPTLLRAPDRGSRRRSAAVL